jgi:hypothetical protein
MGGQDVLERRYHEVYEALYAHLQERRLTDPAFTPEDVRGFLKDAYLRQGNDWIGHGALFDVTQSATIAAHEAFLAEWEAEREDDETTA